MIRFQLFQLIEEMILPGASLVKQSVTCRSPLFTHVFLISKKVVVFLFRTWPYNSTTDSKKVASAFKHIFYLFIYTLMNTQVLTVPLTKHQKFHVSPIFGDVSVFEELVIFSIVFLLVIFSIVRSVGCLSPIRAFHFASEKPERRIFGS